MEQGGGKKKAVFWKVVLYHLIDSDQNCRGVYCAVSTRLCAAASQKVIVLILAAV
jgi:hypothetical protein